MEPTAEHQELITLAPGTVLDGRYLIERHIASGGMGEVFQAEHIYMKRKVALKLLRPEFSHESSMAARFQREAQLVSQLDHPHIVKVFDFGKTGAGLFFLAMELVEGQSLEAYLRRVGALPPAEAIALLGQLLSALGDAHRHGIVHRDLKPDNVLLAPRADGGLDPKVLDFGIARLAVPDPNSVGVTQLGVVLGTPEYLSPEQALGQPVDQRADLYSLSVIGFRMLTGRLPFTGPGPQQYLSQHATQPAPTLVECRPELRSRASLTAAFERGLAKAPETRFQTAAEFASALGITDLDSGVAAPSPMQLRSQADLASALTFTLSGAHRTVQLPTSKRPTENLTIVYTDLKETSPVQPTREEHQRRLELHREILGPIFDGYRGHVSKNIGDAFMVTFRAPTDALLCGMAIQDRLAEHNAAAAEADRLLLRIAVSQGEVQLVDGDVFGDPVNLATQVEHLTEVGEVCFTEGVFLTMNRAEIPCELAGTHMLAGVDIPVRVYRVLRDPQAPLPHGGLALTPLRPTLHRRARSQRLRRATGRLASGLRGGIEGTWDLLLDALIDGPGWRRSVALLILTLMLGGVGSGGVLVWRHHRQPIAAEAKTDARPDPKADAKTHDLKEATRHGADRPSR